MSNWSWQSERDALLQRIAGLEHALTRLSTAECFGDGEILGKSLSDDPMGREILARMKYARTALEGEK